jgi:molecular chaperone DnaK
LSDNEVQDMVKDAESHADEDQKFRDLAEARNQADQLAYQLEKTLNDLGDKVTDDEKEPIKQKIDELREAAKGDDVAAIRTAIDEANQSFAEVSQRMYEQAGAADAGAAAGEAGPETGGPQEPGEPPADQGDDVIDADFEAEDQ